MTVPNRANTELVAQAWLASLPFLNTGMVNPRLPEGIEKDTTAQANGFVTLMGTGGTPNMYVPERQPVVGLKAYGFPAPGSRKAPFNVANRLLENIIAATYDTASFNATLSLGNGYPTARVHSAHAISEIRPSYGDSAYWAVYTLDLQMYWVELP
jgi:hypothetical protein